jgi:F-type H+-transporting ATPase subunit epsilon
MANTFEIEIATPEKLLVRRQAETAQIPGKDGYMGILPGHAALLSELGDGTLSITAGGQTEDFHVIGGYVEVRDDHVRVAADRVE